MIVTELGEGIVDRFAVFLRASTERFRVFSASRRSRASSWVRGGDRFSGACAFGGLLGLCPQPLGLTQRFHAQAISFPFRFEPQPFRFALAGGGGFRFLLLPVGLPS